MSTTTTTISLLPATANYDVVQGDKFAPPPITVYDGDVLVDFTGADFDLLIVNKRTNVLVGLYDTEITYPDDGQVQITIPGTETETWPTKCELAYRLRWNTEERTYLTGVIVVEPKIDPVT